MPSGLVVGARGDLDVLFKLRSGVKRPDVGFMVAGVDISNRYEQIGGGSPIAATGFKIGAADLSTLFKNINDTGAVTIVPSFISESVPGPNYTTGVITATSAGATTFTWTMEDMAGGIAINSPNSASTTLSVTGMTSGATRSGGLRCTTNTGATAVISVYIYTP